MNPLFQQINTQPNPQNGFMTRFRDFKKNFSGDPQQMVQQMLNSGRISQAQYDNAVKMANQMMGLFK